MSGAGPEGVRARKRRRASFPDLVLRVTLLAHLGVALGLSELARRAGLPAPALVGGAAALVLVLPLRGRMRALMSDHARPAFPRVLLDELYLIHWCAAFGSSFFIATGCVLAVLVDLARGAPVRLPAPFALGTYLFFLAVMTYGGLVRRRWVRVRRLEIKVRGLPPAFDGYRVAQLSDLHIGGMTPRSMAERWVRLSNREGVDLTVVTGDLVTSGVAFHDVIAEVLSGLRSRDGVVVSMGNHDYFGEGDPLIEKMRARGLTVLRNDRMNLERGGSTLRLAAVDDTWTGRANLETTLRGGEKGAPTILLAHDPDLFDQAVRLGASLVLSGHTHAGQFAVPFLVRQLNLARIRHPYTYGLYTQGDAVMYVHAGLGTTGPPVRVGAAPEVVVFTLRPG